MGRILLLDDDELITTMLSRALERAGHEVKVEHRAEGCVEKLKKWNADLFFLDIALPDGDGLEILGEVKNECPEIPVVMLTADDTAETAIKAMKLGAVDYITKPFSVDEVKIIVSQILEVESLKREVSFLRRISSDLFDIEIVGNSASMRRVVGWAEEVAKAGVKNILITGESGTGKELLARYIHHVAYAHLSPAYPPFIGVNCAALPETLLESELFGYEKGAFTDAQADKKGIFQMAEGGTILLDEVSEMSVSLQAKLLRVLEERKIRRLGGAEEIPVDVRIIATTNRNLEKEVAEGRFRLDLYYRLNAFSMEIPPLRERKEDIPLLSQYFLAHFSKTYNKKKIKDISPEAVDVLRSYGWPGNVRELKNVLERIVVLESSDIVRLHHLPQEIRNNALFQVSNKKGKLFELPEEGYPLREIEREAILQALKLAGNNRAKAAKLLDISYDTLRYKLKKHGLENGIW